MVLTTKQFRNLLTGLILGVTIVQIQNVYCAQTKPLATNVATNSTRQSRKIETDKLVCGSLDDLVNRVDYCAKPLMDLMGGRLDSWPQNEEDAAHLCERFGYSERCIKEAARKCAKGLPKTIISTIGSSIQRVRRRECSKGKYPEIVTVTQCIEKNQNVVKNWMSSVTARLEAVEAQQPQPEKKINSVCCMVSDIEKEIKITLDPFCPNEAKYMTRLYRGVIDSAIDIVCRQPKCQDYLKGLKVTKKEDFQGLIAIMLRIVLSLDAPE